MWTGILSGHYVGAVCSERRLLLAATLVGRLFSIDTIFFACTLCRAGVGPKPIAIDRLTEDKLVEALEYMRRPEAKAAANIIAAQMQQACPTPRPVLLCKPLL